MGENIISRNYVRSTCLSLTCAAALLHAMPAMAQETDEDAVATFDTVVVTGTNIRGAQPVGSATTQISADDLAESGKTTAADFLRDLPMNLAGGVATSDETQSGQDTGANGANLTGGQGVNLRGLGALSTLVLIDGRRAPASGQFGDFVDISTIPSVAISNIQVLQDGASAVYGSDAVGGVVNFILKKQADNPVTTIKTGVATEGGGEEFLFSHLQPFNWDTGNLVVAGEYYTRENVEATDRDVYSQGSDFTRFGGVNWPLYSAHYGETANIYLGGQGGAVGSPVGAMVPVGSNAGLTGADLIPVTDGVGYTANVYDATDMLPRVERSSVYAALTQDITPGLEFFADARYTNRENTSNFGYYAPLGYSVQTTSPYYITGIDPSLVNADGSIPFSVLIDDRPMSRTAEVKSYSATAGVRYDLISDWVLEAAITYAKEEQQRIEYQPKGTGFGVDTVYCALAGTAAECAGVNVTQWNPFSSDPLSTAQINEYFGSEQLDFDSELFQASAKVDGSLFEAPAGTVKFAAGVDFRREGMEGFINADTLYLDPVSGPYTRTERDAVSVFGELLVPLHKTLDLSLAGRYEEFDADYGSEYDDFNPKIGLDFKPVDGLKVFGSWGTSFHAPPMRFENDDPQPLPGGNAAFTLTASRFGPCDSDLISFNGVIGTPGTAGEECSFSLIINSGGAGAGVLEPEQAETWTVGFDYEPPTIEGLTFGLSYFDIEITDRIQRIQSGQLNDILADFFATNGGGAFASALTVNPTEAQAAAIQNSGKYLGTFGPPLANSPADITMIVNATQINIAALREQGFDFRVNYDFDLGAADLGLFAYGTYLTTYEAQPAPGLAYDDLLGKYTTLGSPVPLRAKIGGSYDRGQWSSTFMMNYVDDYECESGCYVADPTTGAPVLNTSPIPIDSWVTFDLGVSYDFSEAFDGFLEGTVLALNVNNVFNEEAPFLDGGTGSSDNLPSAYDPANHTIIGRTVGLTLTKTW
jgi:outer membrane receptor protein involved in Fe transport